MKNKNKKGFTIVELVIVIAVIAILAAVLIPTFASIVKKANLANDTAVAKNLNTAAIAANADTFDKAIEAVKEAGYLIANLNAKSDGCYLVWEEESNQFFLYDLENKTIIYSNTDVANTPNANWYFSISNPTVAATVSAALPDSGINIKQTVENINDFDAWVEKGGTQTIYIDESFVVDGESTVDVDVEGATITLKLGGSTISTNGTIDGAPIYAKNATLNVEGGTLNASGAFTNENGTFMCAIGYEPGAKVNVDGTKFIGVTGINGTMKTDGHVELVVKNSTFDVTSCGVILSTGAGNGSIATIENCTINAGQSAILTSQSGTITVESGSYKGREVLYCMDSGSKIIVNGGDFDGAILATGGATIEINGGTFKNTGLNLENFKAYVASGKTVTDNGNGTWTVG